MEQFLSIQRCLQGAVEHEVKVTRMEVGYGVRVFTNGVLNQEGRVETREEIGPCARELLRWEDKCGNISPLATCARERSYQKG